jgi:environmental stress-induced protein Ves
MSYSLIIRKQHQQITNPWSGGTTTQLAIFPADAEYIQRNFKWRISCARIDLEHSLFTALPGFKRIIMIIDGEMFLEHDNQDQVFLQPFQQNSFNGESTTQSFGQATDFNLMLAEGCRGEIKSIHLQKGIYYEIESSPHPDEYRLVSEAFYCIHGTINIIVNLNESLYLKKGDLALITRENSETITFQLNNPNEIIADVIRTTILYS